MFDFQQLIYALEAGSLSVWIRRGAVVVMMVGLGAYYYIRQFNGLDSSEAMDQAQVARQLCRGEGFSTKFVRPLSLSFYRNSSQPNELSTTRYPDLVNPPLYPLALAAVFKVSGVDFDVPREELRKLLIYGPEEWIVMFNTFCLIAGFCFFYFWMMRCFDDRVAFFATVMLVLTDLLWAQTIAGLAVPLCLLLVCLAGLLANEALRSEGEEDRGLWQVFCWTGAAVCVGLLALTRYPMLGVVGALVGLGFLGFERRAWMAGIALLVPLALSAPWYLRNIQLTGSPWGLSWVAIYVDNGRFPLDGLWRTYDMGVAQIGGAKEFLRAVTLGVSHLLKNWSLFMGGVIPTVLFLGVLFHVFRRYQSRAGLWFWAAALGLTLFFNAAVVKERDLDLYPHLNNLVVFLPVLCGFGAAFFYVLVDRVKLPSPLLVYPILVVVGAVHAVPLAVRIAQDRTKLFAYPPYIPPLLIDLKRLQPEDRNYVADIPWATAWYTDRISVWLPRRLQEDYYPMNDFALNFKGILLTPYSSQFRLFDQIQQDPYVDWAGLIMRKDFSKAPLPAVNYLWTGREDYLYLSDRK